MLFIALARYRQVLTEDELEILLDIQTSAMGSRRPHIGELLSDRSQRLALFLGVGLHMAQQFSAINAVRVFTLHRNSRERK